MGDEDMRYGFAISAFCLVLKSGCVLAHPSPVTWIDNMTDFKSDTSNSPTIILQSFASVSDGGGGTFVLNGSSCGDADDGVIVHAGSGSGGCYYRQFSGAVHLPWYGVKDAADPDLCYNTGFVDCDATPAVMAVFAASAKYGDGSVTTFLLSPHSSIAPAY
jgi:hypothetical protein